MASAPFTIQDCLCIRGGFGSQAIYVEYEKCEANTPHADAKFILLTSTNKVLMTKLVPKQEVPRFPSGHLKTFPDEFIKHLQKLRNAAVDQLLMQHLVSSDPMGTHTAGQALPKQSNRVELFKAAAVPKIITIKVDDISDEKGALIAPSRAITLHSSDRKDGPVQMQLSEDILTWLQHAVLHSWGEVPADEDTQLHAIIHSHLMHATNINKEISCHVTPTAVTLKRKGSRQQLTMPRKRFHPETIEESVVAAVAALQVLDKRPSAGSSQELVDNDE